MNLLFKMCDIFHLHHMLSFVVSSMKPDSQYTQCRMSADSANTCMVEEVFDHAAQDRVMYIKVNGSFGACSCRDELIIQLSRIGELCIVPAAISHNFVKNSTEIKIEELYFVYFDDAYNSN